ncbi:DNA primase family protein [Flavobacterium soyangense]|uniref:DNA primase n=1 Tax=Flavobacterium soyangense TaxID=2023265 RepID=A0A930UAX4_9FLAO|nr:phage/plasmid primase, P4 family [Flavobacterium soyangense]MBF2707444.1 DNA primase [Flavobacterium soyangense]
MKNKKNYINGEIDFNELSLNPIIEKPNTNKNEIKVFQSMMQKAIKEEDLFRTLLEDTEKIDFELEANKKAVLNLREKLNDATDFKMKEAIEKEIQKKAPNEFEKYVMIIRQLLVLTEEKGFGMGISNGDFYFYNAEYWVKRDNEILTGFLGDFAEKCGLENLQAQQFKVKDSLFKQFQISAPIPGFNSKINEIRIPVENGTLILNGGKIDLIGFKKEHFLKYKLNFKYDINAKAVMFQAFLDRILPDKKLQNILLEFLGYVFVKDIKIEKMLLLFGFGSNGKSVINDIIYALLGKQNMTNFSLSSLCNQKSQTRALIENTLLNFAQEIGNGKFEIDMLKTLVSNQPCESKLLYKNPFIIENYGRFMFNCNTLPKNSENTNAFYRRFIILPFNETISDKEKDINLASKIIANELPGVFNMVIDGMKRLRQQGNFTKSEIVDKELEKYRRESSSILSFIDDENYIPSPDSKMGLDIFYQIYRDYCTRNGFYPYQIKNLSAQLRNAGFEVKRSKNGFTNVFYAKLISDFSYDGATIIKI